MTLYEKLGGEEMVRAVVTSMYEKILGDDRLSMFFVDVDVEKLRHMNTAFVGMAFGAPHRYTSRSLREAHVKPLEQGLSPVHFDIMCVHLREAMKELRVDRALIEEGMKIIEAAGKDILNQ